MVDTKLTSHLIEGSDMQIIRNLAIKYKLSVGDFARVIIRQAERNLVRWVRLSQEEYDILKKRVASHNTTITRWCYLACREFISNRDTQPLFLKDAIKNASGNRNKRIRVSVKYKYEDAELSSVACDFGVSETALIRYCAMRYDGNSLKDE